MQKNIKDNDDSDVSCPEVPMSPTMCLQKMYDDSSSEGEEVFLLFLLLFHEAFGTERERERERERDVVGVCMRRREIKLI